MFARKGVIYIEKQDGMDEDAVMMDALDAGAEDMIVNEDNFEIRTEPTDFHAVLEGIQKAGYEVADSDLEYIPSMEATVDPSVMKPLNKLINSLEDNDDVQKVHYNCELDEE